jgi:hypothetical protein
MVVDRLSSNTGNLPTSSHSDDVVSLVDFPAPLGAREHPLSETSPVSPNRKQAMQAYVKGRRIAKSNNDFAAALGYFRQAFSHEASSTSLFAIAQCQKALNRPIEALFTFASALYEDNRMPSEGRLHERFTKAATDNINYLLKRFVPIYVVLPDDASLKQMTLGGIPLMSTNLYGQLTQNMLLAGVRASWIPRQSFAFSKEFVFFTKPGVFNIEFVLSDGRRLLVEKRRLTRKQNKINLNKEPLPAKIVIENIQPGTRIVFKAAEDITILDREFPVRTRQLSVGKLKRGEYDLVVSRSGFDDFIASYSFSKGQTERVYLDLQPKPLIKSWKLWLGVGLVAAAAIVTTVVVLTTRNEEAPLKKGNGVITVNLLDP